MNGDTPYGGMSLLVCLAGAVRFVQADAVRHQLEEQHVVLLSGLAYSAAGEVGTLGFCCPAVHEHCTILAVLQMCVQGVVPGLLSP